MRKVILLPLALLLLSGVPGQNAPRSDSARDNELTQLNEARKSVDSTLNPKTLDGILSKMFSKNSTIDGKWVYFKEAGNIQKLTAPEVSKVIPEYRFYKVRLTNFLGYHINSSTNLILFDSLNSKIIQAVPMWYADISQNFLKLFIGKHFADSLSLLKFTFELQDLMKIGSTGNFGNTKYKPEKLSFDYTNPGPKGPEVWRHIEMFITDHTIKAFRSSNPKMNESVMVK